jgi:hypothetical protein
MLTVPEKHCTLSNLEKGKAHKAVLPWFNPHMHGAVRKLYSVGHVRVDGPSCMPTALSPGGTLSMVQSISPWLKSSSRLAQL